MMTQCDAVVVLVGEDEISSLVNADLQAAIASGKPTFAIVAAGAPSIALPSEVRILQGGVEGFDPATIAKFVGSQNPE